jgi:hypothetical protein
MEAARAPSWYKLSTMNRVKLWVFTVVVVGAAFLVQRAATVSRRSEAVAALDARLASAAAHVAASTRAIAREATAAVAFVARDEKLAAALRARQPAPPAPLPKGNRARPAQPAVESEPEETTVGAAARAALEAAEKALAFDLPRATVVTAGNRESVARKGDPSAAESEAMAFLRGAIGGQPRHGFVRLNGALWYGAATPAGDGAGVVLLVPFDQTWAKALATAAGVDVTLSVPDVKPVSTAKPSDVPLLHSATKLAGAGDVGSPGPVDVSVGPLRLPKLPQPIAGGAAFRARAVPLEGMKGGFVIVSAPAGAALEPAAAFHWRALAALALVLVAGLVLGFFVRSAEPPPQVPNALVAAAARIEKGDFAARAPQLAGKLGTIAAALNRAAELAGPAQAARGAPAVADGFFQGPARPAPVASPPAALQAAATPPVPTRTAAVAAVSPPVSAPASDAEEESHWQQVFQEFLRTRATFSEPSEGLTYEKFRQKLEANKAQLVAKYNCKTVRFQVYVKDGKAALKATPVK